MVTNLNPYIRCSREPNAGFRNPTPMLRTFSALQRDFCFGLSAVPFPYRFAAHRIIGTAGPPLGSPPMQGSSGHAFGKGVIIPPARTWRSSQYPPVKERCEGLFPPPVMAVRPASGRFWDAVVRSRLCFTMMVLRIHPG